MQMSSLYKKKYFHKEKQEEEVEKRVYFTAEQIKEEVEKAMDGLKKSLEAMLKLYEKHPKKTNDLPEEWYR